MNTLEKLSITCFIAVALVAVANPGDDRGLPRCQLQRQIEVGGQRRNP